jgi:DNA-binding XRE family transcriptional regulator
MRFQGRVEKAGRWWAAEVPILDVYTQGRSKQDAYTMVADAIEALIDKRGFKASVFPGAGGYFEVSANDVGALVAFMLRQRRATAGLSLAEAAERMGAKSRNAYARYEQGAAVPSIDTLGELLAAIGCRDVVLSVSSADEAAE